MLMSEQSDQFQSVVGSVGALCNGAGRLFWGNMLDSFGFKRMFAILAAIQVNVTCLTPNPRLAPDGRCRLN